MKLKKWLYGVSALAMLTACSEHDVAGGDVNGGNQFLEGISYLGINIELPSEPSSRADDGNHENDVFDDGLENEYKVTNAALLLFKGATEGSAKFVGAYELSYDHEPDYNNTPNNVTTSFHRSIRVLNKPTLNAGEKLWGLALVNYDTGHFKISAEDDGTYGNLIVDTPDKAQITVTRLKDEKGATEGSPAVVATTFDEFRTYTSTCEFHKRGADNGISTIFMTNAPLSTVPGTTTAIAPGSVKIQTLAELQDNFKLTEKEALDSPSGCVFVERAVAKITCSKFPTSVTLTRANVSNETTSDVTVNVASVEWMVDNEETTSYIVRNAKTENTFWECFHPRNGNYRFVGGVGMSDYVYDPDPIHQSGHNTWYRTYWCLDPNYSTDKAYNDQATVAPKYYALANSNTSDGFKSVSALYPHENTFDVAHQNYMNTTRVIFKVKYEKRNADNSIDNNFKLYAIRGQLKTFYLQEDAENLLKGSVLRSNSLIAVLRAYAKDNTNLPSCSESDLDIEFGGAPANIEDNNIKKGDFIITSMKFKDAFKTANFKSLSAEEEAALAQSMADIALSANVAYHIVPFTDNTCYYALYIRHFGDTYCPLWNDWKGDTTPTVYESEDANKYLGRYGMVRNNWYDLQVDKIGRLGNAAVPRVEGDDTSDDNELEEWFLSARIHVLSWAKRTQKHEF